MKTCSKCGKLLDSSDVMQNLYGEALCEDCWDDYVCTERGKVEYFVDIATEKYSITLFDADFLGEVYISWENHKHEICSEPEIFILEHLIKWQEFLATAPNSCAHV